MGAKAPTPNTARLAPQCAGLPQLVERPTFGGNRCNNDSSLEQDSPADPKMGDVAAVLVQKRAPNHYRRFESRVTAIGAESAEISK